MAEMCTMTTLLECYQIRLSYVAKDLTLWRDEICA